MYMYMYRLRHCDFLIWLRVGVYNDINTICIYITYV